MGFWVFGKKEDKIKRIENNIRHSFSHIKNDISLVNKFLNHLTHKNEKHENRFEKIEQELVNLRQIISEIPRREDGRSIVHERSIAFNRSNQSFMNVQSLKNSITPAQKRVIHVLSLTDVPLEYESLAKELKLNIVTVRRHLNDIKKMGFDIKEKINIENGRKVFFMEKLIKRAIMSKK